MIEPVKLSEEEWREHIRDVYIQAMGQLPDTFADTFIRELAGMNYRALETQEALMKSLLPQIAIDGEAFSATNEELRASFQKRLSAARAMPANPKDLGSIIREALAHAPMAWEVHMTNPWSAELRTELPLSDDLKREIQESVNLVAWAPGVKLSFAVGLKSYEK